MHHTRIAIFLICSAPPALAEHVHVNWSSEHVDASTVRVWADLSFVDLAPDFVGFGGTIFDVLVTDSGLHQSISFDEPSGLGRLFQQPGASPGTLIDSNIVGIDEFQLPPGFNPNFDGSQTLPEFFVFEYTITDFTQRVVTVSSQHLNFEIYTGDLAHRPIDVTISAAQFEIEPLSIPLPPAAGLALMALCLRSPRPSRPAAADPRR